MRLLIAAAALAAISTGAAADRCASPGGPSPLIPSLPSVQLVSVPVGGCVPPAVQVAEAAICTDAEGGPMMVWDGGPRCLTESELLGLARAACRARALADWRALRDAAWLPDDLTSMGLSGLPEVDRQAAAADSALLTRVRTMLGVTGGGAIDGWTIEQLTTCADPRADPAVVAAREALYDWPALLTAAEAETGKMRSARLAAAVAGVQP